MEQEDESNSSKQPSSPKKKLKLKIKPKKANVASPPSFPHLYYVPKSKRNDGQSPFISTKKSMTREISKI